MAFGKCFGFLKEIAVLVIFILIVFINDYMPFGSQQFVAGIVSVVVICFRARLAVAHGIIAVILRMMLDDGVGKLAFASFFRRGGLQAIYRVVSVIDSFVGIMRGGCFLCFTQSIADIIMRITERVDDLIVVILVRDIGQSAVLVVAVGGVSAVGASSLYSAIEGIIGEGVVAS